jgi:hypothetical protein
MDWSRIDDRRRRKALGPLAVEWRRIDDRRRENALGTLGRE